MVFDDASSPSPGGNGSKDVSRDIEDLLSQALQWNLGQYCTNVLVAVLALVEEASWDILAQCLRLTGSLLRLANVSLHPSVWSDPSQTGLETQENIHTSFALISHCISEKSNEVPRIKYLYSVLLGSHLLRISIPTENPQTVLPRTLLEVGQTVLLDSFLEFQIPQTLQKWSECLQGQSFMDEIASIPKSMETTTRILRSLNRSSSVQSIQEALPCLIVHRSPAFLHHAITVLHSTAESDRSIARSCLLQLLSHEDAEIKSMVYAEVTALVDQILTVKSSLSVSKSTQKLRILFHSDIWEELLMFGLTSQDEQVQKASENIVGKLLNSCKQLPGEIWEELVASLEPVLSLLQSHADPFTHVGRLALNLLLLPPENLSKFQRENWDGVCKVLRSSEIELRHKLPSLTQLALLLHDPQNQEKFLHDPGLDWLLKTFLNSLNDHQCLDVLPPCLTILRHLCLRNSSVRSDLSQNHELHSLLFKGSLVFVNQGMVCHEAANLFFLLLFHEVIQTPQVGVISVPSLVASHYKLPLQVKVHAEKSVHAQHQPILGSLDSHPLKDHIQQYLRTHWTAALHGGFHTLEKMAEIPSYSRSDFSPWLLMDANDLNQLRGASLCALMEKGMLDVENATSHSVVLKAIHWLSCTFHLWKMAEENSSVSNLISLSQVKRSITRYLSTTPSSVEDKRLFDAICSFLCIILTSLKDEKKNLSTWLSSQVHSTSQELLFEWGDPSHDEEKLPNLMLLYSSISNLLPEEDAVSFSASLIPPILHTLHVQNAPDFYSLSWLKASLGCLVELSRKKGWSSAIEKRKNVCTQFLALLLEVLAAFHLGRGSGNSFMGRGITLDACICLNHIGYEFLANFQDENWLELWLYKGELGSGPGHSLTEMNSLTWLVPLFTYRDPEVRTAGLTIALILSMKLRGRELLTRHLHQVAGGIWGAAFSFVLDHYEACMVREKALWLVVNLLGDSSFGPSMGPSLRDPDSQVQLNGVDALQVLLHHSGFFSKMNSAVQNFYPFSECWLDAHNKKFGDSIEGLQNGEEIIVTPSFLSALCHCLKNLLLLLPGENHSMIVQTGLPLSLARCLDWEVMEPKGKKVDERAITKLYGDILELLAFVLKLPAASSLPVQLLRESIFLHCTLFCLKVEKEEAVHLWSQVMVFLQALLGGVADAANILIPMMSRNVQILRDTLPKALSRESPQDLQNAALEFVTSFCISGHKHKNFAGIMDKEGGKDDIFGTQALGFLLAEQISGLWRLHEAQGLRVDAIHRALGALLTVSSTAKFQALNSDFLATISQTLLDLELELPTIQISRRLLNALIVGSTEAKVAVISSAIFPKLCLRLFPVALSSEALLGTYLCFLASMTSVAQGRFPNGTGGIWGRLASIIAHQAELKLQRKFSKQAELLFQVLAHIVQIPEGRHGLLQVL
ncbi:unnamed protein product [Darwinula stevensoni]|uniref:Uncharacterized protein n=1 Tax=Darwinula stevensoni TaxID=69355 RepID=A0A7R8X822_9CRUS|nr:unnamed protein product [Darwinula stevensoni]CAG0881124.1 unnamed protein product [Darwinula stevensoni]